MPHTGRGEDRLGAAVWVGYFGGLIGGFVLVCVAVASAGFNALLVSTAASIGVGLCLWRVGDSVLWAAGLGVLITGGLGVALVALYFLPVLF